VHTGVTRPNSRRTDTPRRGNNWQPKKLHNPPTRAHV